MSASFISPSWLKDGFTFYQTELSVFLSRCFKYFLPPPFLTFVVSKGEMD